MRQPAPAPSAGTACTLGRLGASHAESETIPGVFVHAAAVQSVMTGNLVRPLPLVGRAAAAVLVSLGGSLLGFVMTPWSAFVALQDRMVKELPLAGGFVDRRGERMAAWVHHRLQHALRP